MLIKLSNIYSIYKILQKYKTYPLPVLASYHITLMISQLKEQATFYDDKMADLLKQYAEVDENGYFVAGEVAGSIKLKSETLEEGQQAFQDLENLEIEINNSIDIQDLEKLEIPIEDMEILLPIIKTE